MSPTPLSDPAAIAALASRLTATEHIALDTEFLRERTYRPQLCLLQLATPTEAVCIDPLGAASLTALQPAMSGGTAVKIMHAARQDLEVLWPLFGAIAPVFDTQVAAALLGMPAQIGYSDLVRRLLGVELAKGETRTDWSRRPLTDAQLRYAIDDVVHLAALRDQLQQQLGQRGRLDWMLEEMRDLARPERLFVDPEKAVQRLRWSGELDADRARLAQRLAAWRERRAADKDRPRNWILDDSVLRALVLQPPRSSSELAQVPGLAPGFAERSGATLLGEIAAAQLPDTLPPQGQRMRPDPQQLARVKQLSSLLQQRATQLEIASEVLATRRELESIARGETSAEVLQGWRREVIGAELLAVG
jgi:ribonuclease D